MRRRWGLVMVLVLVAACQRVGTPPQETTTTAPTTTTTATTASTTTPLPAACTASGLPSQPESQEELPEAVAEARREIVAAATDCDYDRLAQLAGPDFSYSFGESGDPATYWRQQEEAGQEPLRFLVEILDRPHATDDGRYLWPSAFAYDDWASVPEEDRQALRPLYGDEDFEAFEQFGAYIGYRVGIDEDGTWRFFVAGD